MIFERTSIPGALVVRPQRLGDDRGHFARLWCHDEFAAQGLDLIMLQASSSYSAVRGTLRGLHYAAAPAHEGKLVRCQRGTIHDVIVDLRPQSPAFLAHFGIDLRSSEGTALYVPPGVAHGFQTLEDDCEVHYMMSEAYRPELACGVRFDDPAFGIAWPLPVSTLNERDQTYPDFDPSAHRRRSAEPAGT